jgi:phosphohistidine swiveling domain-containing protein
MIPFDKKWVVLEKEDYANYLFVVSTWEAFTIKNPEYGFKNFSWLSAEYINKECNLFCPLEVYQDLSKDYLASIFTSPAIWYKLHQENIYYAKETFRFAREVKKLNVSKMSDKQILSWLNKFEIVQQENHDRRGPMFMIEVKDNLFSNYLMEYLRERCNDLNSKISPLTAFQILTTPTKKSIIKKQQEDLAMIALLNDKTKQERLLIRHVKKYEWLEYGLQGKVLDIGYFRQELSRVKNRRPKQLILKYHNEINDLKLKQRQITKNLKIHRHHQKLFNIARESIYVKVLSKDAQFYSYYATENLFKELARRGGLTLEQVRFLTFNEYQKVISGKNLATLANDRMKYSIHFADRGKTVIYAGSEANQVRKKINFIRDDNVLDKSLTEFGGSPAYPGKVSGKVKIINSTQEMMKMHRGDILVSHMTNPDIVPAMKLAAAIVTDLGGITCHAAIISRELKIPCVIGTKIATQVLKDGDKIEVDALKGIIKKI